jgi:PAS domain S-box-containing protein
MAVNSSATAGVTWQGRQWSAAVRYTAAVGAVALGWAAREVITPAVGPTALPFVFFFPPVAVAAWFGGFGPGLLSVVLSTFIADWAFIEPVRAFAFNSVSDYAAMMAFAVSALIIVGAIRAMHRARSQLALAHDVLRTTIGSIGDAVIATDEQGRVTFLNAEAERLTQWTNAEATGQPLTKVFPLVNEQSGLPVQNPVEQVLKTGAVSGLANPTILIGKNGRRLPIDDRAAPIRQAGGPLMGVVLVFRDVTEQRVAHEAQARLAAIVAHSGDVILTKSLDGIIQSWNVSAERLFGYRAEEIVGNPVTTLFPPERRHEEDHILERLRAGEPVERLETVRVAKDGRKIPVFVSVSPLRNPKGELVGASTVIHDITDLVAAREALQREKELLATTLASIGDAVIITDAEGRVTFLNGEAERLTKWKNAEAANQPLPNIFRIINEESRAPVESPADKVLRLGTVVGLANHTLLIAKDGTETPIDDSAAPIRHGDGPLFGVVLVFRDFTEQKKAQEAIKARGQELEGLVQQRTAKLQETVGELEAFSYSIAHDMRGPLRAMQGFSRILLSDFAGQIDAEGGEYLQRIEKAANRMDRLITDILNYSKVVRGTLELGPTDVQQLISEIVGSYPDLQSDKADIVVEPPLPPVLANDAALTQVISNLLANAVKFVAPGVRPRVRVWGEARSGVALLWFEDNGIGIASESQARLFNIFTRLNRPELYEGTGIGLAIVRKAVERMGGAVGVESEEGKGSRFWVRLQTPKTGGET